MQHEREADGGENEWEKVAGRARLQRTTAGSILPNMSDFLFLLQLPRANGGYADR